MNVFPYKDNVSVGPTTKYRREQGQVNKVAVSVSQYKDPGEIMWQHVPFGMTCFLEAKWNFPPIRSLFCNFTQQFSLRDVFLMFASAWQVFWKRGEKHRLIEEFSSSRNAVLDFFGHFEFAFFHWHDCLLFQNRTERTINLLFFLFIIVVPSNSCVFLSCSPFVVNTAFLTGLVDVEVSSVFNIHKICWKGLQERNTQLLDGTTVKNR